MKNKVILLTGISGFIGYFLAKKLLNTNHIVIGIDNLSDYYDVTLKKSRLKNLGFDNKKFLSNKKYNSKLNTNLSFIKLDLVNFSGLEEIFIKYSIDHVINLAAQAGVRYSLINPKSYIDTNLVGYYNLIQLSNKYKIKHFIYASSSSVYGLNDNIPFSIDDNVDKPASLYAATKKSNELIAHSYSNMFNLKTTGLRFFTVYGPYGRPDMALFIFTKAILSNQPIKVFNNGNMQRDFTYVDDIVNSIFLILNSKSSTKNDIPYNIFNIGKSEPTNLLDFIKEIEKNLNKKAIMKFMPIQVGDVEKTYADMSYFNSYFNFTPQVSIKEGVKKFISWYLKYYKK